MGIVRDSTQHTHLCNRSLAAKPTHNLLILTLFSFYLMAHCTLQQAWFDDRSQLLLGDNPELSPLPNIR